MYFQNDDKEDASDEERAGNANSRAESEEEEEEENGDENGEEDEEDRDDDDDDDRVSPSLASAICSCAQPPIFLPTLCWTWFSDIIRPSFLLGSLGPQSPKDHRGHQSHTMRCACMYRMGHLVGQLGWIDYGLRCSNILPSCSAFSTNFPTVNRQRGWNCLNLSQTNHTARSDAHMSHSYVCVYYHRLLLAISYVSQQIGLHLGDFMQYSVFELHLP